MGSTADMRCTATPILLKEAKWCGSDGEVPYGDMVYSGRIGIAARGVQVPIDIKARLVVL
jgi:hypothetical protein